MERITEENYVDTAEQVIKKLASKKNPKTGKPVPMVTTSKIRNILAMTADIYNSVMSSNEDRLSNDEQSRLEYLRVRIVYEAGRDQTVKNFVEEAGLIDILKLGNGSKKGFILFNRYMESLVAFHRFYNGKD